MRQLAFASLLLLVTGPFGPEMKDREKLEMETARYLAKVIPFYESMFERKLTNISDLFAFTTSSNIVGYPYWHEHYFRKFHKDSGFTNSVLEKYVVVQPGIHVPALKGELALLNAQPYRSRERKLERMLICRVEQGFTIGAYPEEHLQELLRKAGQKIPAATSLPRPPPGPPIVEHKPPLTVRYIFERVAVAVGLGKSLWLTLLIVAVTFGTTLLIAAVLWAGRRARRV